ncbi:unnamed protein product [Parascedosporium putredinis]|uniref:Uncharacterized protein n=1 Tax=Parascedosporium putredinis TaxID=1442378 RepID=A0A9P1M699_9PEZI|nr:unnamed protein product [Parascedosporium putredinis]CAI7988165.1 unnamed protein product [Parascedosporium putredinis]
MAAKRDFDDEDEDPQQQPFSSSAKRARRNLSSSLPQDDELEFEDDTDAMAYLRSVSRYHSPPLVAPKIGPQLPATYQRSGDVESDEEGEVSDSEDRSAYDTGLDDQRGYYQDGAYTAAPDEPADYLSEGEYGDDEDEDPAVAATAAYLASSATFTLWNRRIEETDPLPAQVAAMDKDAVLRVLRIIMGGRFLRVGRGVSERTSRWLWALLAALPPAGELSHTDVAWVRDLGRRAVLLGRSIAEMAVLREEVADGGGDLGLHDAVDDSGEDGGVAKDFEDEGEHIEGDPSLGDQANEPPSEDLAGNARDDGAEPEVSDQEEGEASEAEEDAPMDLDSDAEDADDLEAAKARLLARLDNPGSRDAGVDDDDDDDDDDDGDDGDMRESDDAVRARANLRVTVNMILTVAGEFYGQRDLLEFRDPFAGM